MMHRRLIVAGSAIAAGAVVSLRSESQSTSHQRFKTGKSVRQTLISTASNIHVDTWSVAHVPYETMPGVRALHESDVPWSVRKSTLHGGRQEGVDVIEVDNGALKFTIVPTRGMSVGDIVLNNGVSLGWSSPVRETVHPKHVDLQDHGGLGWLTGFNELLVRCGVAFAGHPGVDGGQLLPLHGRIGNIPASEVEVEVEDGPSRRITVRGRVDEAMFKFCDYELWTEISTVPGSDTIQIHDRLINRSSYAREYQLIYHTNFGPPLLEGGAKFVAPVASVAPFNAAAATDLPRWETYRPPTRDFGEHVFCVTPFADANQITTVGLVNASGDRGVAMRYDTSTLPYFTLWKNTDTIEEGYVTGLEPGTGFPCPRAVERQAGRVPRLEPGASVDFNVELRVLRDVADVNALHAEVEAISNGRPMRQEARSVSPA